MLSLEKLNFSLTEEMMQNFQDIRSLFFLVVIPTDQIDERQEMEQVSSTLVDHQSISKKVQELVLMAKWEVGNQNDSH